MRILVLGGTGSLGSYVIEALLKDENASLRLYGRKPAKLEKYKSNHVEIIKGDVLDEAALKEALKGVDGVYAGLAGSLESMANTLVKVMSETGVKRLVWITSYGIYDGEVPADAAHRVLTQIRRRSLRVQALTIRSSVRSGLVARTR